MASKNFWFKFVPADWRKDPDLSRCSLSAKGFWIDAVCILQETEEPGVFKTNGIPWPDREIVAAIGVEPEMGLACLSELLTKGVCSRSKDGAVFARRIVRDHQKRIKCIAAGKSGGNPALRKGAPLSNVVKGEVNGTLKGEVKHPSNSNSCVGTEEFTLSSVCTESTRGKNTQKEQTVLDVEIHSVATRLKARHPRHRSCGMSIIERNLRSIVRLHAHSMEDKLLLLSKIDSSHAEWCESWDWNKDGGQYVKELDNWLAPTMERWDKVPAPVGANGIRSDGKMAATMHAYSILPKL